MRFLALPIAWLLCCGCAWVSAGAGTLRSLEFEIAFLPLRSPKHTLMLGKSPYRGADGSIRLRCQHRVETGFTSAVASRYRGELRCRHVARRAKDRTGARDIAERMADGVGNPSLAFFVGGLAHGIGERRQTAACLLQMAGRFAGRFGVSHIFSSVVQSKCHRIYSAISATEQRTFPAACASSIKHRRSLATHGRLSASGSR